MNLAAVAESVRVAVGTQSTRPDTSYLPLSTFFTQPESIPILVVVAIMIVGSVLTRKH